MEDFPPRGSGDASAPGEGQRAEWWSQANLGSAWDHQPGKFLLGHRGTRQRPGPRVGLWDNRHIWTMAGSRSGKTLSLVIPNVRDYPGSQFVIDPKGEIARATLEDRRRAGHRCIVLKPFPSETAGLAASGSFNPFEELRRSPPDALPANAAQLASSWILDEGKEPHWPQAARNMALGAILHLLVQDAGPANIRSFRRLVSDPVLLVASWRAMAASSALDDRLANIGNTFLSKVSGDGPGFGARSDELRSIHSVLLEQTRSLDDVAAISEHSDFSFDELADVPTTIYATLPGLRLGTHSRWLRMQITQLLSTLERRPLPVDPTKGQWPLRMVLEEFAVLGNMESIETAAGYMAGFGVQLWVILQDLTQMHRHYPRTWESFLANAGILTAFNVVDATTTQYLSRLLGTTSILEKRSSRLSSGAMHSGHPGFDHAPRDVPLLSPSELTFYFARETMRQLVIVPGCRPIHLQRIPL